jgi:hypothetical protein
MAADLSYLPPEIRNRQVMSWCPFCHLGWQRDPTSKLCCAVAIPTGNVLMHVPAITWDRETVAARIQFMFRPRPWEIGRMRRAGIDPRTVRRQITGLKLALEKGAKINDLVRRGIDREVAKVMIEAQYDAIEAQRLRNELVALDG